MYAAKREGGQCIRSFAPDMPCPYAFPQSTDSTVSGVNSLPANTSGNIATLKRMLRPSTEVTAQPPDEADHAPKGVRWPPTAIRIALAVLAIGLIAFSASSVFGADASNSVFFAKSLYPALNLSAAALVAVRAYHVTAGRLALVLF